MQVVFLDLENIHKVKIWDKSQSFANRKLLQPHHTQPKVLLCVDMCVRSQKREKKDCKSDTCYSGKQTETIT